MRIIHPSASPMSLFPGAPFMAQSQLLQTLLAMNFLQHQLATDGPYAGLAHALLGHAQLGHPVGPNGASVRVGPRGEVSFSARSARDGLEALRAMSRQLPKDDWRQPHLARSIKDVESRLAARGAG